MPFKDQEAQRRFKRKYQREYKKRKREEKYTIKGNVKYPKELDQIPYPDPNWTYVPIWSTTEVGNRRLRELKDVLPKKYPASEGYFININGIQEKGVDIKITKDNKLDTIMEVTNDAAGNYISKKDLRRYRRNFRKYSEDINRVLITSYEENLKSKRTRKNLVEKDKVKIWVMGHQA